MTCVQLCSVDYSFMQMIYVLHSNMKMWKKLKINWILIYLASVIRLSTTNQALIKAKIRLSPFFLELNVTLDELNHQVFKFHGNVKIKRYTKVTYLGCILDEPRCQRNWWCCTFLKKSALELYFFVAKIDS